MKKYARFVTDQVTASSHATLSNRHQTHTESTAHEVVTTNGLTATAHDGKGDALTVENNIINTGINPQEDTAPTTPSPVAARAPPLVPPPPRVTGVTNHLIQTAVGAISPPPTLGLPVPRPAATTAAQP